ncbi:hypothetical protein K435DRAFT_803924 [Dendrothele bispora CBS 962.96]|uniref:FHA domain-containing protein n=1 Tax=Dendrothele bispora (strain CBS 962.96) TaxID=1314807 RepID=A0A4S8LG06_DENBC|nr:hypothetical protein K435DRAFT_803924 [Dendrothele bispora CBS 962.96]
MSVSPATDPSQPEIGRFGTLSLALAEHDKRQAVGIESEVLTFGRDTEFDITLDFPDLSPLHCKITFDEERKAFLVVLGGVAVVDGCKVRPSLLPSLPTTVPLPNHTKFKIDNQKFTFSICPPKQLRARLDASPSMTQKRVFISSFEDLAPGVLQIDLKPIKSTLPVPFLSTSHNTTGSGARAPFFPSPFSATVSDPGCDAVLLQGTQSPSTQLLQVQPLTPPPRSVTSTAANTLHGSTLLRNARRAAMHRKTLEEEQEDLSTCSLFLHSFSFTHLHFPIMSPNFITRVTRSSTSSIDRRNAQVIAPPPMGCVQVTKTSRSYQSQPQEAAVAVKTKTASSGSSTKKRKPLMPIKARSSIKHRAAEVVSEESGGEECIQIFLNEPGIGCYAKKYIVLLVTTLTKWYKFQEWY